MACSFHFVPLLLLLTLLLLISSASSTAALPSMRSSSEDTASNATAAARLRPGKELLKYKRIRALLKKLNKPSLKTIQVIIANLFVIFLLLFFSH